MWSTQSWIMNWIHEQASMLNCFPVSTNSFLESSFEATTDGWGSINWCTKAERWLRDQQYPTESPNLSCKPSLLENVYDSLNIQNTFMVWYEIVMNGSSDHNWMSTDPIMGSRRGHVPAEERPAAPGQFIVGIVVLPISCPVWEFLNVVFSSCVFSDCLEIVPLVQVPSDGQVS